MKVWVHINGIQEGPFELDNMPLDRMGADTPVWYNGLPDWMPARLAPDVARVMAECGFDLNPSTEPMADDVKLPSESEPVADEAKLQSESEPVADEAKLQSEPEPMADEAKLPSENEGERRPEPQAPARGEQRGWRPGQPWPQRQGNPQQGYQQPAPGYQQPGPGYQQPGPGYRQAGPQPGYQQPWRVPTGPDGRPLPCPPTYLVWSILLTVLCCNPVGIVPIIYGSGVKSKFYSGNVEGARRASETTEWWLAVTIVVGLILSCCGWFII